MKNKGVSEKSLANLKMFEPGKSGNPAGRPKGAKDGMRAALNRILSKQATPDILKVLEAKGIDLCDKTYREVIDYVLVRSAVKGDLGAIKTIFEQTEVPLAKEGGGDTNILQKNITVNINPVKVIADGSNGKGNGGLKDEGKDTFHH